MRTIRIIDNKKIRLTADEFKLYQDICREYSRQNFKGEDLFKGLFESDKNGIIVFLKPPRGKRFTMEVILFLLNVMVHQHLGTACDEIDRQIGRSRETLAEVNQVVNKFNSMIEEGNALISELKKCREDSEEEASFDHE